MAELLLRPSKQYTSAYVAQFTVKQVCAIVSGMDVVTDEIRMNLLQSKSKRLNDQLSVLLIKVSDKNKSAFEQFYDSTIKLCFSQALRITNREDIAEEVVSDVYVQVWNKAANFDESRSGAMTWLMMLCRSRALDAVRHRKSQKINESIDIDSIAEPSIDENPLDLLNTIQQGSLLQTAILQLKPQQRQLLSLAYFKGLTHTEISDFTEIPLGTVKTQIRRAVIMLKELMCEKDSNPCQDDLGEAVL